MSFKRIAFFGIPLDVNGGADDICQFIREKDPAKFIDFISPDTWLTAKEQSDYAELLEQLSLVLPDGQGIANACKFFTHEYCEPMSFDMTSLARPFLKTAVDAKASVAFIGGEPRDDEDVQEKLKKYFPGIDVVLTTHGFGDFAPKVAMVMDKKPAIVLVSMPAPRQEAFLLSLRDAGYKGIAIGCGNFFTSYMSDNDYQEYPAWVDRYHLMSVYRVLKEPSRLWQRYVFQYYYFMFVLAKGLLATLTEKRETVATQATKK